MGRRIAAVLLGAVVCAAAQAQPVTSLEVGAGPADDADPHGRVVDKAGRGGALGLRVRSVAVEGYWARGIDVGIARCDLLTPDAIAAAMETLEAAIVRRPAALDALATRGQAELLFIDVDFAPDAGASDACGGAPTVGVVFKPFHLRVGLERLGDNVLPLPRWPYGGAYEQVPAALRVLDPHVGAGYDKAFGPSVSASVDADLLGLVRPAGAGALRMLLQRVQSTRDGWYRNDVQLAYEAGPTRAAGDGLRLRLADSRDRSPLAGGRQSHAATDLGGGFTLKADRLRLALDSALRRSRDDIDTFDASAGHTESARLASRALVDTLLPAGTGLLRAALWHELVHTDGNGGSTTRLAAAAGIAREIGSGPGLGVELVGGAGHASGRTREADRYFAGSPTADFLYDPPSSPALLAMPRGPLLRSLGQGQGALAAQRGGRVYWHLDSRLALPVRAWSRPLIPDEPVDLVSASGAPMTVRTLLDRQIDVSAPSMLAATLRNQGLGADEARAQAADMLAEITPAVHDLIDRASVYAVRPLLLVDAAGLSRGAAGGRARWLAVGAGIGLTVVTARFEAGYLRTVSGPAAGVGRGAAFARLVFQNLF